MEYIKLLKDGIYGKKGDQIQVTHEEAKRMIKNGFADPIESSKKAGAGIRNKSLSASA